MPPDVDEIVARRLRDLPPRSSVTREQMRLAVKRELVEQMGDNPALGAFPRSEAHSSPRATAQPPSLALQPRILDRFRSEVRRRGLVGEERNAAILYLVITSRLLERQVSAGLKRHSASGKSYTVETVVGYFPGDAVIEFTAMSERALVYSTRGFKHRTLVLYEATALREGNEDDMTSYLVRSLLSEGRIEYEVTVRDKENGGWTTKRITKEGPTNLVFTTTKTRVHAENETRVLSLHTDDSAAQTSRVFLELANEVSDDADHSAWHQLQRWLETGKRQVTIPYATALAELVPPVAVRLRRDFGAVLALIRAHAMLHQATRSLDDEGRIVATIDDYVEVHALIVDTISAGVEASVPPTVRATVAAVAALARDEGVTVRAVSARLDVDKSNASRRLRMAAEAGFDVIAMREMQGAYDENLSAQMINGSGVNGQLPGLLSVSGIDSTAYTDASPTVGEFWSKAGSAAANVSTNRKLPPEVALVAGRRWFWIASALDGQNLPVFRPEADPDRPVLTPGESVGSIVSVPAYIEGGIPLTLGAGTEDRVIFTRPSDHLLFESGPRLMMHANPISGDMQIRIHFLRYVAWGPGIYPTATSVLSGTGLAAPTFP